MNLSVAYTFEPSLAHRLAAYPEVREVFGKLDRDAVGGGRSTYTLRPIGKRRVAAAIRQCHQQGIRFNYLLNAANLGGIEHTRGGQRRLRRLLDWVSDAGADSITVASPYLLRIIVKHYSHLSVRVGAFAVVDNPAKARAWEDMGADALCLSAIACNRDFAKLARIRDAVQCELQLIVNASCILHCTHELTHMNLLTQSSRHGDSLNGFCMDYCMLHCSAKRLTDPVNYMRSTWIRPEDLYHYEALGYNSFKIVERSCPGDLLMKRVHAYVNRHFDGNLLAIAGPVAQIKREQATPRLQRIRLLRLMMRPEMAKVSSLIKMKKYAQSIIFHEFERSKAPVFIDNKALNGFIEGVRQQNCEDADCGDCGYCDEWARRVVHIEPEYRANTLKQAAELETGLLDGSLWL